MRARGLDELLRNSATPEARLIEELEKHGPKGGDGAGHSFVHLAAMGDHGGVLRWLAKNGADLEEVDERGWGPIHHARGRAAVDALVEGGVDIEARESEEGRTPLLLAIGAARPAAVEALLDRGASSAARDLEGRGVREWGRRAGKVGDSLRTPKEDIRAVVERIEERFPYSVSAMALMQAIESFGIPHWARDDARRDDFQEALRLIARREPDELLAWLATRTRFERLPLYAWVQARRASLDDDAGAALFARLTSALGATRVEEFTVAAEKDPQLRSPMATPRILLGTERQLFEQSLASRVRAGELDDHPDAVFIGRGVERALHFVVDQRSMELATAVLDAGASVDASTAEGLTALNVAASHGDARIVELLLRRGASVKNAGRFTALQSAVMGQDRRCVELVLAAGADPMLEARRGPNALLLLKQSSNPSRAELLPLLEAAIRWRGGKAPRGLRFAGRGKSSLGARDFFRSNDGFERPFTILLVRAPSSSVRVELSTLANATTTDPLRSSIGHDTPRVWLGVQLLGSAWTTVYLEAGRRDFVLARDGARELARSLRTEAISFGAYDEFELELCGPEGRITHLTTNDFSAFDDEGDADDPAIAAIDSILVPRGIRIAPCSVESDGAHTTFVLEKVRKAEVDDAFAMFPSPKTG